eukprot:s125_g28.t1
MFEPEEPESKNESKMWYSQLVGPSLKDFGEGKWRAVVPVDNIMCCPPWNATHVLRINTTDPEQLQIEATGCDLGNGKGKWKSGVLGADGNIYCPPCCRYTRPVVQPFLLQFLQQPNYNAMAEVMEGAAAETLGVAACCASCCSCCCGGSPEETCGLCCAGCSLEALGCAGCCDACCCCGGADDPGTLIQPQSPLPMCNSHDEEHKQQTLLSSGCCTLALDACGLLACCEMLGCVACFSCCCPCCFRQKKDLQQNHAESNADPQVVIAQGPVMYPANFTPEQMAMGPPRMMYPPQPQMMGYPQAQGYQFASRVLRIDPYVGTSELIGPEFTLPDPIKLAQEFGDSIGDGDGDVSDENWGKWMDGTLAANGCLYCQPWCASHVLKIDTRNGSVELIGPDLGWAPDKYRAAVVATDGVIYCPPHTARRVMKVEISTDTVSFVGPDYGTKPGKWWAGAMTLVNSILCAPHSAGQVLQIDLFRQMCTLVGRDFGSGEAKYRSIVQSNDGCFYCPPCNAPQVLCIDPLTPDADYVGPDLCCGGFKWVVAGLGEDGCVYSPPWLAHKSLRVDVPTRWARQIGKNQGWGGGKWEAMYPHEDGFFYCPPCCATDTLSLDTLIGTTELLTPELGREPRKWRCTGRSAAGELYCPPFEHDKVLRLTFKNLQLESPSGTKDSPLSRASSRVQESRASSLLQG